MALATDVQRALKASAAREYFTYFLRFLRLQDARQGGRVKFEPWPHQVELADLFQRGESVIILKARQLGVSWVIAAYVLWHAMYRPYAVVILISKTGKPDALELMAKVDRWYQSLPQWLRVEQTRYTKDLPSEMEFANGSKIIAFGSTEDAGRSFTATLVVVDEAGFHPYAADNYAAYGPTLTGEHPGQMIMCSTANGPVGLFADLWRDSSFRKVFYPWWAAPYRQKQIDGEPSGEPDMEWLARERANYPGLPADFQAEFPASAAEAFVSQSGLVFGLDDDGIPIFSTELWPKGNISDDPCDWNDCQWHYAGIDWGGSEGNASVCDLIGVTSTGRVHKFHSMHTTFATVEDYDAFLTAHCPPNGFDSIECGADEPTSINTLAQIGWPARKAETDRKLGLGTYKWFLKNRRFTENPECRESIAEYHTYFNKPATDPTTKVKYATKTPHDHHADHKDATRYVLMRIMRDEASRGSDFGVAFSGVDL